MADSSLGPLVVVVAQPGFRLGRACLHSRLLVVASRLVSRPPSEALHIARARLLRSCIPGDYRTIYH